MCVCVCLQWGPALYLCYKRAVAKANALVYKASEYLPHRYHTDPGFLPPFKQVKLHAFYSTRFENLYTANLLLF